MNAHNRTENSNLKKPLNFKYLFVRSTSVCTSRGLCSKGNNVKVSQTRQCLYDLAMSIQGFFIGNSREQSFCKVKKHP